MNFVVAYVNFFDNELKMTSIMASSKEEAMLLGAAEIINGDTSWLNEITFKTEDDIKDVFFDTDQLIEAHQV